jgi:outer membrane protein TolC
MHMRREREAVQLQVQHRDQEQGEGRVSTGLQIAEHVRRAADLEIEEARAEIVLQVRTAYFQAVLAQQLVAISE